MFESAKNTEPVLLLEERFVYLPAERTMMYESDKMVLHLSSVDASRHLARQADEEAVRWLYWGKYFVGCSLKMVHIREISIPYTFHGLNNVKKPKLRLHGDGPLDPV